MRKKHFTKQLAVVLSEETYNQVIEETNRKEVTVSEWIRKAIEEKLNITYSKATKTNISTEPILRQTKERR